MNLRNVSTQALIPVLFVLFGVATGLLGSSYLEMAVQLGYRIPQPDMASDYTKGVIWAIMLALSIVIWPVPLADKKILMRLWLVRCLVTLVFMLFYEHHYGLDAFWYFEDSRHAEFDWSTIEFGNGSANIQAVVWFLNHYLPTTDSYHAIKVSFSMMGLLGIYIAYRGATNYLQTDIPKLLYIFGLFPSILFWSSILGKDPLQLLGISLYIYGALGWIRRHKFIYMAAIAAGITLSMFIRIWTGFIFLGPFFIIGIRKVKNVFVKVLTTVLFVAGIIVAMQKASSHFSFDSTRDLVKGTNYISRSWVRGGSSQTAPEFHSVGQMVAFAPVGMFTALFRPLPGEILNLFGILAGLENLLMLVLLILAFNRGGIVAFKDEIVVWALSLVLIWSFIYGFVSYQNLGSAARFKLQILPVLLGLTLYLYKMTSQKENQRKKRAYVWHSRFS